MTRAPGLLHRHPGRVQGHDLIVADASSQNWLGGGATTECGIREPAVSVMRSSSLFVSTSCLACVHGRRRRRFVDAEAQTTQLRVSGRAIIRSIGISLPQISQVPYVPDKRRSCASASSASVDSVCFKSATSRAWSKDAIEPSGSCSSSANINRRAALVSSIAATSAARCDSAWTTRCESASA